MRHPIRPNLALIHSRVPPELACDLDGVDTRRLPPFLLVACTVDGSMMGAAQRDSEFVAGLAAEGAWLHVPKMVRVRGLAAADEARLLGDVA